MTKTTLEMDGLIDEKDIKDRYKLMYQCRDCAKWAPQNIEGMSIAKPTLPCQHCQSHNFDPSSGTSLRTYNPFNKRKPK